jgi:hypothetical protein
LAKDWAKEAKGTLRGEMTKRGVTYKGLSERLAGNGVSDSDVNLRNKISRGTFTAAFFLQCLDALGVHTVRLDD